MTANEAVGPYGLVAVEDPDGPAPLAGPVLHAGRRARAGAATSGRPHLGRAFSVCRARGGRLEFLLEAIGPGTERLAALGAGRRTLWLVGPLGIGFTQPPAGRPGAAGRRRHRHRAARDLGARRCASAERQPLTLLGFRSASTRRPPRLFDGDVAIATDDGTGPDAITASSPTCSKRELARGATWSTRAGRRRCSRRCGGSARRARCQAQLAMEAGMACGFGACFGCVVRTRDGYRRLCVDGPVVRGRRPGRRTGSDARRRSAAVDLRIELAGLELEHPVLNGSGTFDAIAALRTFGTRCASSFPFAAFVSKTITLAPRGRQPAAAAVGDARPG